MRTLLKQRKERERYEENLHRQLRRQMISENLLQKQCKEHEQREWWKKHEQMLEEEQKIIKAFIDAGWTVGCLGGRDRGLER